MRELAVTLLLTVTLVPISSMVARRLGFVAARRPDRWGQRNVPRLGGLAISAGLLGGIAASPIDGAARVSLLAGTLGMAGLGLVDDVRAVLPLHRLLIQSVIGAFVGFAFSLDATSPIVPISLVALGVVSVPLLANATNLVDNADGLATCLSAVTGLGLAGIAVAGGLTGAAIPLGLVIAAAGLGFFLYNAPPARAFMGDVGSLTFGFAVAGTSLLIARDVLAAPSPELFAAMIAVPVTWAVQVGDLAMVFLTRLGRGVSPFRGGVDHTSHRLMLAGLSPRVAVAALTLLSLVAALLGLAATASGDPVISSAILVAVVIGMTSFETIVARRVPHQAPVTSAQRQTRSEIRSNSRSTGKRG